MFNIPTRIASNAPQSPLERQLIIDFLKEKGYQLEDLKRLSRKQSKVLMSQACTFASLRLAEIEARSQFQRKTQFEDR